MVTCMFLLCGDAKGTNEIHNHDRHRHKPKQETNAEDWKFVFKIVGIVFYPFARILFHVTKGTLYLLVCTHPQWFENDSQNMKFDIKLDAWCIHV